MTNNYGEIVLVNLLSKKKIERPLSEMFERVGKNHCDILSFDIKYECKHNNYENLSKLLKEESISKNLTQQNWSVFSLGNDFLYGKTYSNVITDSTQKQFFRVNCMDCIDRTNIVQCLFVRKMLELSGLPEFKTSGNAFPNSTEEIFVNSWADNEDQLANSYAGTKALKGDILRNGKREGPGHFVDFYYLAIRYFISHYTDGYHQDALDYSVGRLANFKSTQLKKHSLTNLIITVIIVAIALYFGGKIEVGHYTLFQGGDFSIKNFIFTSVFTFILGTALFKVQNKLIDHPTINH